jgi:hypothetical protein
MSHDTTNKTTIKSLPDDLFNCILGMAPQLGLTNKAAYERLPPKSVLSEHVGITFPSVNSKPENLIEISHCGITFLYETPKNALSYKWDGVSPAPHGAGGRYIYKCNFCEENDEGTTMVGSHTMGGVLFVCPECQHGLTTSLKRILGETLWELIDANQQIMVPRTNGPNEMWYVSSRLPVIHRGTWHLRVQSHQNLVNEECLNKVVPVKKLKELNEAVSA